MFQICQRNRFLILVVLLSKATLNRAWGVGSRRRFLSCIALASPIPCSASTEVGAEVPLNFSGVYRDPQHPEGYRVIRSMGPGLITLSMQDEPAGPLVEMKGQSRYNPKTGETSLEFLPKQGESKTVSAVYSPSLFFYINYCQDQGDMTTRGGVKFSDSYAWVKEGGLQGVYVDSTLGDGYRTIREVGNGKLVIDYADRAEQVPVRLPAVINKTEGTVVIDFRPRGGKQKVSALLEDRKITFSDGKTWLKL